MSKAFRSYTFRAECEWDALLFRAATRKWTQSVNMKELKLTDDDGTQWSIPDREVVMEIEESIGLANLRWIAEQITDCHVIAESLQTSDKYTGEREYGQESAIPSSEHRRSITQGFLDYKDVYENEVERLAEAILEVESNDAMPPWTNVNCLPTACCQHID